MTDSISGLFKRVEWFLLINKFNNMQQDKNSESFSKQSRFVETIHFWGPVNWSKRPINTSPETPVLLVHIPSAGD